MKVFISYSHEDKRHLEQCMAAIQPLADQGLIDPWLDTRNIEPGQQWSSQIEKAIDEADAAILIVSPRYLESSHVVAVELPALVRRLLARGALLPVLIEPVTPPKLSYTDRSGRNHQIRLDEIYFVGGMQPLAYLTEAEQAAVWSECARQLHRLALKHNRRQTSVLIPDIDWVEIPAGEFLFGDPNEQQILQLDTFWIARYPITNIQYQTFIDDGGYSDQRWWEDLNRPGDSAGASRWPQSNRPRTDITWTEAVAFTRWLSSRTGEPVRLPTLPEWEKAARGARGLSYPWGDEYVSGRANIEDTSGDSAIPETCAVGLFPEGASPFGVMDMYGNVWEWCLTTSADPDDAEEPTTVHDPESDEDGMEPDDAGQELLVGCSWMEPPSVPVYGRSAGWGFNRLRAGTVGFRIVRAVSADRAAA